MKINRRETISVMGATVVSPLIASTENLETPKTKQNKQTYGFGSYKENFKEWLDFAFNPKKNSIEVIAIDQNIPKYSIWVKSNSSPEEYDKFMGIFLKLPRKSRDKIIETFNSPFHVFLYEHKMIGELSIGPYPYINLLYTVLGQKFKLYKEERWNGSK